MANPMLQAILEDPEQRAEMMKLLKGNRGRVSNRDKILTEMKKLSETYPKVTRAGFKKIAQEAWDEVHPDGTIKKDTKPGSWQAFVQEKMEELKEVIPDNKKRFEECAKLWKAKKATTTPATEPATATATEPSQDTLLQEEEENAPITPEEESSDWEATEQNKNKNQDNDHNTEDEEKDVIDEYNESLQKIPCELCGDTDDSVEEILLCDKEGCDKGCHVTCAGLKKVPTGNWYCAECKPKRKRKA